MSNRHGSFVCKGDANIVISVWRTLLVVDLTTEQQHIAALFYPLHYCHLISRA